ncbi:MAG: PAS-domain containing protein [Rhizobiaceae bacterium]|nr:PAS-domain containing protein [Rhizobiaceae bacterium]
MPKGFPENSPKQKCEGEEFYFSQLAAAPLFARFIAPVIAPGDFWRNILMIVGSVLFSAVPSAVFAQASTITQSPPGFFEILAEKSVGSGEVILFALFGGAMSFAMMAAFWLIRERNLAADENQRLTETISGYKATNERIEALVHVSDQRIVLWGGNDEAPMVNGSLSTECGAPLSKEEFLSFGKWLRNDSFGIFNKALQGLRKGAESFDMALQTTGGGVIEAQGRTSGGFAFVRFIELTGSRAALAHLEVEHVRLLSAFDSIQNLFDRLDMQVWLAKKDGGIYWVNKAYASAVEVRDSIAAVENNSFLFDQQQRSDIQTSLEKEGYYNGSMAAIISGDRKIVDVVEVVGESGGAGIAVDKSDVETIRNRLEQTITNHSNTLDQLATAIAIFDENRNLQFYNSSFQHLWKLDGGFLESNPSNADVLGAMRDKKRLPPQPDWRKWRDDQLKIYQALEPREEWWHLPDGITLRVVVNPQSLGGATWIFEDVTEELELKSSYNSLIRVQGETLDHLSEAVAVFGSDGKIRLSNPALWKMLQLDESDFQAGKHISELSQQITNSLEGSDVWDDIVGSITGFDDERGSRMGRLYLKDKKIFEFSLVPLPDGRMLLTLVDVTANVNIELALTERNEALEEAGNLKNRFLQHVSYELRTPLTTISGFGELLSMEQTGALNAVQSEYLDHINSSSGVLKAIIDDILDLATIDAGAMELDLVEFEIAPVVDKVVENLSSVLENSHVSINVDIDPNASRLIADKTRFRQIIYNLISNAIAHSPDGGNVSVGSQFKDDNILVFVCDQGPGVPVKDRELIFNRFESGAKGDARRGAGLGLSIVQSFMKLHEGGVHIEEAGERGARFICSFPASPVELNQAAE